MPDFVIRDAIVKNLQIGNVTLDIVRTNLVSFLDAGNTSSYSGSGTTWTDLSGNSNNGTLVNGPTYTSASPTYILLDGSNDYVTLSSLSLGASSFTAGGWLYYVTLPSSANNYFSITNYGDTGHSGFWAIYATTAGTYFWCRHTDGSTTSSTPTTSISSGSWYHIMAVRNTATNTITQYINGTSTGDTSFSGSNNCADAGSYTWVGVHYNTFVTNMRIGALTFYNRALTQSEVQQNFNATRSRFGI